MNAKSQPFQRLTRALILSFLFWSESRAAAIQVRSGTVMFNFYPAALAALNYGSNPNIGALIFEEFFRGDEDRLRTRNQLLQQQIVPGFTAIPATCLKLEVNGSTVTNINPPGQPTRNRKPSTFSYDPANVTGTATGEIGLTGTTRFIGDFTGAFVLGDYVLRYNLPAGTTEPQRGWVFVNNFDFQGFPAFETSAVTVTATGGKLVIEGKLAIARELDLFFFPGDRGKVVGDFRFETPTAPVTPPSPPTLTRLPGGNTQLSFFGKGNAIYQVQYSPDLSTWTTVDFKAAGRDENLIWTDSGPPSTVTSPSVTARRFYRLLED
jgi:hypothetical protein